MVSVRGSLSFRRIVNVPFETFVAALDSWQRTGQGELQVGDSLLCGPVDHDRETGTRRLQVRLRRGPLRPLLPMRLDIDRWSTSSTVPDSPGRARLSGCGEGRTAIDGNREPPYADSLSRMRMPRMPRGTG